jgi:GTP-binding protein HflX
MGRLTYEVDVAPEDGQGLAWLHENTEILERRTGENGHSTLQVRLVGGKEPRFRNRFPQARVL